MLKNKLDYDYHIISEDIDNKISIVFKYEGKSTVIGVSRHGGAEEYNEHLGLAIATDRLSKTPYATVGGRLSKTCIEAVGATIISNIQRQIQPSLKNIIRIDKIDNNE